MKIEPGKYYRNGKGGIIGDARPWTNNTAADDKWDACVWVMNDGCVYRADGGFGYIGCCKELDLVEECTKDGGPVPSPVLCLAEGYGTEVACNGCLRFGYCTATGRSFNEEKSKMQLRDGAWYRLKNGTVVQAQHTPDANYPTYEDCKWCVGGMCYDEHGGFGGKNGSNYAKAEFDVVEEVTSPDEVTSILPVGSQERKDTPIYSGVLAYFPRALAYVAKVSKVGNDKHNPGQPLHWSKHKSNDHADCVARHLIEHGATDPEDGLLHSGKLAWRALALLEIELENAAAGEGGVK